MITRSILAAPDVGMVHGSFGADAALLADRVADGDAFPEERLVRIPRRFVRDYHGAWLVSRSRLRDAAKR